MILFTLPELARIDEGNLKYLIQLLAAVRHGKLATELNGKRIVGQTDLTGLNQWRLAMLKCSEDVGDQKLNEIKFLLHESPSEDDKRERRGGGGGGGGGGAGMMMNELLYWHCKVITFTC